MRRHFLYPGDNYDIVNTGSDTLPSMEERRAAGGASVFKTCARNAFKTRSHADVRAEMVLSDKGRTCKITEVKRFDLLGIDSGVAKGVFHSFDSERAQIFIWKSPESSLSNAYQGHRSHIS